ncbi:MAG: hypothetical protein COB38_05025 [Gammaproteobacteria bacterium]|nr:MAG: hypothetical protein COB38_05025 [Gammaproteobacteria bacterium]
MEDKLTDFMVEMATNETLKKLYRKNPAKLMEIYELEKEDINLLISKNYELIRKRLGADYEISFNSQVTASRIKP